jgi:hypothetical protein
MMLTVHSPREDKVRNMTILKSVGRDSHGVAKAKTHLPNERGD